jgi:hypothetical protein
MPSTDKKTAEQGFRDAFERLKDNKPTVIPPGSPITQNNIAREAGRDPSALKRDRYPLLILEIQVFLKSQSETIQKKRRTTDNRSRTEKQQLADCRRQRDKLASIVAAQNSYIEELVDEIERLSSGKVISTPKAWT